MGLAMVCAMVFELSPGARFSNCLLTSTEALFWQCQGNCWPKMLYKAIMEAIDAPWQLVAKDFRQLHKKLWPLELAGLSMDQPSDASLLSSAEKCSQREHSWRSHAQGQRNEIKHHSPPDDVHTAASDVQHLCSCSKLKHVAVGHVCS